jgi:hypothetical protein
MHLSALSSKDTYYQSLTALVSGGYIKYTPGRNQHESAVFELLELYRNEESTSKAAVTQEENTSKASALPLDYSNKESTPLADIQQAAGTGNIPKPINNKPKRIKEKLTPAPSKTYKFVDIEGQEVEVPLSNLASQAVEEIFFKYFSQPEIRKAWQLWETLRAQKGKKHAPTIRATELNIMNLDKICNGDFKLALKVIERSTKGSGQPWDGLFPYRDETVSDRKPENGVSKTQVRANKFAEARNEDFLNNSAK